MRPERSIHMPIAGRGIEDGHEAIPGDATKTGLMNPRKLGGSAARPLMSFKQCQPTWLWMPPDCECCGCSER